MATSAARSATLGEGVVLSPHQRVERPMHLVLQIEELSEMTARDDRRGFLGLIGAATCSVLAVFGRDAAARVVQSPEADSPDEKEYTGESTKGGRKGPMNGDFQEALDAALEVARTAEGLGGKNKAERSMRWTLKEISGFDSGSTDKRTVKVTIAASSFPSHKDR